MVLDAEHDDGEENPCRTTQNFCDRHQCCSKAGHLIGDIGVVIAEDRFGVRRRSRSGRGFDAVTPDGKRVEIKLTQSDKEVAFSPHPADHVLVFRLHRDANVETVYNGPAEPIYAELPPFKENQRQQKIALSKLRSLDRCLSVSDRLLEPQQDQ